MTQAMTILACQVGISQGQSLANHAWKAFNGQDQKRGGQTKIEWLGLEVGESWGGHFSLILQVEVDQKLQNPNKQEGHEENIRKRSGKRLKMKATKKSKRQKTDSDLEEEEQLRAFLKIVPDEEEDIDYEVLDMRYPIIGWESTFYHTDRYGVPHYYYRVFRTNGSSRYIKTFTEMVSRFDRLDIIELHSLVMQRFSTTTPEGIDLVLWGDLRIMFEDTADDDI
ncbi:hypothetical protein Tco_0469822 [Tanacetum coccineum]